MYNSKLFFSSGWIEVRVDVCLTNSKNFEITYMYIFMYMYTPHCKYCFPQNLYIDICWKLPTNCLSGSSQRHNPPEIIVYDIHNFIKEHETTWKILWVFKGEKIDCNTKMGRRNNGIGRVK